MKKETTKKLAACLLAFALVFTAAGCGGGEQGAAAGAEAGASETAGSGAADASESIGNGADADTTLDVPESEADTEADEEQVSRDIFISEAWVNDKEGMTPIGVSICNHGEESVEILYHDFLFDGAAVEGWEPSEPAFTLEPMTGRGLEVMLLDISTEEFTSKYSELTIQATVTSADGEELEPIIATYQISELVQSEDNSSPAQPQPQPGDITFTSQELYNANGLTVTIPEQTLKALYTDAEGLHYQEPLLHFENQSEDYLFIRFVDTSVNGEAVGIRDAFGDDYYDVTPDAGEACDQYITLGDTLITAVDSGADSGEITLTLYISEDMETALDEAEITIPFAIVKE